MLEVDVERQLGKTSIQATFSSEGGITALFGRSGAGKTSIVNMIAGLLKPTHGRIAVGGRILFDSEKRINVRPKNRRIGYVFQEGRLFPHMTVQANLLYGWRGRKAQRRLDMANIIDLLGLGELLDRRPATLSGGEKQRVAIGRALLAQPEALLLDEPLAALDAARKAEILPYIERLRDTSGPPIVYVSHQIEEVARLADTVVILADGSVAASGPVEDVMGRVDLLTVTGRFQAGSILETRIGAHDTEFNLTRLDFSDLSLWVPELPLPELSTVRVRLRARDVSIATQKPTGVSFRNILPARVDAIGPPEGPFQPVRLLVGGAGVVAVVTQQAVSDLALTEGQSVFAMIKSVAIDRRSLVLPPRTEALIPPKSVED